ncbi:transposase [Aeromonas veronii]|uniref:transposase n=1 Tax=Aeromonas veronii TaxID=654 RepID=UPI003D1A9566
MSITMDEEIKRWTAKRKSALVMEIIQGKTTVAEAARAFDLPPSEIEEWVDDAKRGMENALRAKPLDIREQYGAVSQINHQATTAPAPSDRYTRGFLTGRPRVFSLFMALTYAMTSPTWPL